MDVWTELVEGLMAYGAEEEWFEFKENWFELKYSVNSVQCFINVLHNSSCPIGVGIPIFLGILVFLMLS